MILTCKVIIIIIIRAKTLKIKMNIRKQFDKYLSWWKQISPKKERELPSIN